MEQNEFAKRIEELKKNGTGQTSNRQKEPAGRMDYETRKLQADAQRAREICFMHAKATRETEMLREELIKETAAGEDWETLFYKAVKIIGLATSDTGILPIIEGAARRYKEKMEAAQKWRRKMPVGARKWASAINV